MPHNVEHKGFNRWVRHFFAKQCEWIRVFSKDSINRASQELKINNEKFIVIPEGDYTSVYPNTITQQEARNELNLAQNSKVLLSLGYIKPYKGIENLILEFSKIKNKDVQLIIAGQVMDQNYFKNLKNTIDQLKDNRIQLKGVFIPEDKLQVYYNAADVVVLPFDKVENSGSAIMAMGFKKPIVAPEMGVLKKRLLQQQDLLYTNLKEGLKKATSLDKNELVKIGEMNYQALKKDKWEDFATAFQSPSR
jgi:glycosyltransferase involved in cell wall biosynthesis